MRIFILLQIILFSSKSFSQESFAKGLLSIVNDSENRFQNFRGSIKESPDTSLNYYFSTLTLEGTSQNYIVLHKLIYNYDAIVSDSISKSKGMEILGEWKIRLIQALGKEFTTKERKILPDSPFVEGWGFEKGNVSVFIGLSQYFFNTSLYAVMLYISYEPPK